ncbi:MAG: C40 family peptidase [Candidatus Goldiibacteriota bacterium]
MKNKTVLFSVFTVFLFVSCVSMSSVYDGSGGTERQYAPREETEPEIEILDPDEIPEPEKPEETEEPDMGGGKRNIIAAEAKKMLGKDYSYGGTGEDSGFDCSGLVQYSYKKAGIYLPRSAGRQYEKAEKISVKDAKVSDLVFFSTKGSGPSHVAIYLGDGSFIHSPSSGKKIRIDPLNNPYWSKNLIGAGRYIND